MQEVFDFILSHFESILSVLTLIISVVIFIIRKKPVNGLSDLIQMHCSIGVKLAEKQSDLKGKDKLNYAVNYVNGRLLKLYPDLDVDKYRSYIIYVIEDFLSTPQKKED